MKIYLKFIINLRDVFEIPNIYVELSVQWDLKRKCNSIDPAKTLKLHFQNGKKPCLPSANNNLLDNAQNIMWFLSLQTFVIVFLKGIREVVSDLCNETLLWKQLNFVPGRINFWQRVLAEMLDIYLHEQYAG